MAKKSPIRDFIANRIVGSRSSRIATESIETKSVVLAAPFITGIPNSRKPVHGLDVEKHSQWDQFIEDPEIQKLMAIMVNNTPQNKRWIYNHDNSCKSAGFILAHAIIGSTGLDVKTGDEDLKITLRNYFRKINISDIIQTSIKDNVCFADSVFWKEYNLEKQLVIPKWIDYITLTPVKNVYDGGKKWIQAVNVDSNMPQKSDGGAWKKYEPYLDYFKMTPNDDVLHRDKIRKTHILEEDVINFHFFKSPLLDSVKEVCLWKKWMQFDAKLGGQKYATPLIDIEIERPESIDLSSEEESALMFQIAEDYNKMMNFGVFAHPSVMKINPINQQGQVFNFVQYLEYADKQIHRGILLPVNLLEASGSELATSRTTKDMFNVVTNALRRRYINVFTELCLEQLEFIGRPANAEDFELIFSEEDSQQQLTQNEDFNAIMQMYDRGLMRDINEVRKYVGKFNIELDQMTEEEINLKSQQELEQELLSIQMETDAEIAKVEAQAKAQAANKPPEQKAATSNKSKK